jgi:hypothetical protein
VLCMWLWNIQVRYFQRLPENLKRLKAVAARMAKSGLVSTLLSSPAVSVAFCQVAVSRVWEGRQRKLAYGGPL